MKDGGGKLVVGSENKYISPSSPGVFMFNDTTYLSFNYYDELHDGDVKLGIRVL